MCDDASRADMALSRRTFARGAAGIGFGAALGNPAWAGDGALAEAMVEIPVGAGHADGFFVAPKAGGHPGVVMWPDIAGLRETYSAELPALLVTADRTPELRDLATGLGIKILNKPVRPAALRSILSQWRVTKSAAE